MKTIRKKKIHTEADLFENTGFPEEIKDSQREIKDSEKKR